jgi:hypothetical protein
MKTIQVYDPAMCCSTGVCGPNVDPTLPRFAGLLAQLGGAGVKVPPAPTHSPPSSSTANLS